MRLILAQPPILRLPLYQRGAPAGTVLACRSGEGHFGRRLVAGGAWIARAGLLSVRVARQLVSRITRTIPPPVTESLEAVHSHAPWNKGKLIGQKPPLKPKEIWARYRNISEEPSIRKTYTAPTWRPASKNEKRTNDVTR